MRPASPVVVVSLLILIVALGFSTLGNSKRDYKTLIGAVLYVVGGIYATFHFHFFVIKKTNFLLTLMLLEFLQEISNFRIWCGIQWVKHNFLFSLHVT